MEIKDPFIETLALTVKTRQEVADEHGTTVRTLIRKLLAKGIILPPGNIFPITLKIINLNLGAPTGSNLKI